MSLSNESTTLERWREMFTPEAREERLQRGEHERQKRSTAVQRAFAKQTTKEGETK